MIIDSHAHYNNNAYKKPFRYLAYGADGYALRDGDREQLFQELPENDIPYSIEPGVSLESCKEVLELAAQYPGRIFPAIGIHPTRSIFEKWSDRKKLDVFAKAPGVVAIGECGLDYHYKREEQHRLKQHIWFIYQLDLAWRLKKPVILHVRDAHTDALRIIKWHPARKLGGVIHCFYGSKEIAEQYLKLGYHIGIGGSLLQPEERAKDLLEAVPHIPLDRILVETDAPFILKQKSCESINYFLNLLLLAVIILHNAVECCYISAANQELPKALPTAELLFVIPEGIHMAVSYKKLWKLLIDKDIKKKDLSTMAGVSPATITKMGKNGHVTTEVLLKICTALECGVDDIMEIVPD